MVDAASSSMGEAAKYILIRFASNARDGMKVACQRRIEQRYAQFQDDVFKNHIDMDWFVWHSNLVGVSRPFPHLGRSRTYASRLFGSVVWRYGLIQS